MVLKSLMRRGCRGSRDRDNEMKSEAVKDFSGLAVVKQECELLPDIDDAFNEKIKEFQTKLWVAEVELESERTRSDEMARRLHQRKEAHKELCFNLRREKEWSDQLANLIQQERNEFAVLSQRLEIERAVYAQNTGVLQESVTDLRTKMGALEGKDTHSERTQMDTEMSKDAAEVIEEANFEGKETARSEEGEKDVELARMAIENMQLREELEAMTAMLKLFRSSNEELASENDRLQEQLSAKKEESEFMKSVRGRVRTRAFPQREVAAPAASNRSPTVWANDLYPPMPTIVSPPRETRFSVQSMGGQFGSSRSRSPSSSVTSPMSSTESIAEEAEHPTPCSEIEEEFPCFKEAPVAEVLFKDLTGGVTNADMESLAQKSSRDVQQPSRRRWHI